MKEPICWRRLPEFVPGRVGLCGDALGWKNVALRSYHYKGQDVIVPAIRDFLLVECRAGITPIQRRLDGPWSRETFAPGAVSFLTRAQATHWTWDEAIDVTHIYLSADLVTEVASEMFDRCIEAVALQDVLRTTDTVVSHAMSILTAEAQVKGMGGALYVDVVSRGLIVHLLRNYATVRTREIDIKGALSSAQQRRISAFIDAHLPESLDLTRLAAALSMTPCFFARQFKASFGVPPYAYLMARRLEQAQSLLARSAVPIKQIAADCGFADQAHLTRLFSREFGLPPSQYRQQHV